MRFSLLLALLLAATGCGPGADTPAPAADGAPVPPAPPATTPTALAEWLPASFEGQDRQSLEQTADAALGAEVTSVSAGYGQPPAVTLTVTDFGTAEMTRMMGHGWALAPGADRLGGRPLQRDSAAATVRTLVSDRYLVEATAPTVAQAERALQSVRVDG